MSEEIKKEEEVKIEEAKKEEKKHLLTGLLNFLKEYSVIGMAIGVITAQISKDLIDSIVKGLFMPLITLLIPGKGLEGLTFVVGGSKFDLGVVINNLLTFFIVMTILYIVVKKLLKRDDLIAKK